MPPFLELAPQPMVFFSRTATRIPAFAKTRAQFSPVYPLPTMATSTWLGSSVATGRSLGLGNWSDQKTVVFSSPINSGFNGVFEFIQGFVNYFICMCFANEPGFPGIIFDPDATFIHIAHDGFIHITIVMY